MNKNKKIIIYQIFTRLFGNNCTKNIIYGDQNENGVGKFNDFSRTALQQIKKMGITHIWYTGVIEHATMTNYSKFGIKKDNPMIVKGKAGSPYAIKDYYDVDPDLATDVNNRMKEFEELINRTHSNKIKVIIDFIPNHVARNYYSDLKPDNIKDFGETDDINKSFDPQNNFYYIPNKKFKLPTHNPYGFNEKYPEEKYVEFPAKVTGNDIFSENPSFYDWFETVKLNYGIDYENDMKKYFDPIPNTWLKMKDILLYWAEKGVDGFRCDMAEMVPVEFWQWVIREIKYKFPQILFIAESYNSDLYKIYIEKGGMDYLYDKVDLYESLRRKIEGKGKKQQIIDSINKVKEYNEKMLSFLENHDEQRIASNHFAGDMWLGVPTMTIAATVYKGAVMLYFGQEVGEKGDLESGFSKADGRTTIYDYWGIKEYQKWMNNKNFDGGRLSKEQKKLRNFYSKLMNICKESHALSFGEYFYIESYDEDVFSFVRRSKEQTLLILVNFSKERTINIDIDLLNIFEINNKLNEILFNRGKIIIKEKNEFFLAPKNAYIYELI